MSQETGHIINIFGGKGVGKTTLAAGLFYRMQSSYGKSILLLENLTCEKTTEEIANMLKTYSENFSFVVSDIPLIIHAYKKEQWFLNESYRENEIKRFHSYKNINIFLRGHRLFTETNGENDIRLFLTSNDISYFEFGSGFPDNDIAAPVRLMNIVIDVAEGFVEQSVKDSLAMTADNYLQFETRMRNRYNSFIDFRQKYE